MPRLGWLNDHDLGARPGGADKALRALLASAPPDVELVRCPPGGVDLSCDSYLAFLVKRYPDADLQALLARPYVRCGWDWWPEEDGNAGWRGPLAEAALLNVWVSPLHRERCVKRWGLATEKSATIPPPLDPAPYETAAAEVAGRQGTLWAAEWHVAKGPDLAAMWALRNRERVDFYSPSMPPEELAQPWLFNRWCRPKGFCAEERWLETFASYERFLHLPRFPDAFGYAALEAWLLGLEVVVSGVTGVESWGLPFGALVERCAGAAEEFWGVVGAALP